jgi:hypothetical protein
MTTRAALVIEYQISETDDLYDELHQTIDVLRAHLESARVVNATACIRETADAVLAALVGDETPDEDAT